MDMRRVGGFIRARREAVGLTQKELADRLHITDSAVSKWERGLSLPDTATLPTLAAALKVTEGELLRAVVFWLAALVLLEPVDLLLQRLYAARYGNEFAMLLKLNPYGVAAVTCNAIPSIAAGLWLSRTAHRRQPFPALGGNPVLVWLRRCLPGLTAAFVLWWIVFAPIAWNFTDLGWWVGGLGADMGAWEETASGLHMASWRGLPYFILSGLLYGEYCFRAVVAYFFYGLGVCRYLSRRPSV